MTRYLLAFVLVGLSATALAETPDKEAALRHSIEQLRTSVGQWNVVTEFLREDGSVAKSVTGTYEFSWVVPDRVVSGRSEIPELNQVAGILFYVNERKAKIEMVSVGGDGALWTMTGPLGGEERFSQEYTTTDGGTGQLRFTRFNVSQDAFESRMEYSEDGRKTWKAGHHQMFQRRTLSAP